MTLLFFGVAASDTETISSSVLCQNISIYKTIHFTNRFFFSPDDDESRWQHGKVEREQISFIIHDDLSNFATVEDAFFF